MAFPSSPTLIFRLACWLMAVIALGQIMISGVALAMRMESSRTVKVVEKIVPAEPEIAVQRTEPAPPPAAAARTMTIPHVPEQDAVASAPLPPPRPLLTPDVADPVTERLLKEAKSARVAEDMMSAITKLNQALQTSPNEANVLYELGLCHEAMGVYDRARQYYLQVYQLGTTVAGELYVHAAEKLKQGFEQPQDKINRIVLGRIRVFKDPNTESGERVILTIPIQSVPGEQIDGRDLELSPYFFNEVGGRKEITQADQVTSHIDSKWTTEPLDWATGEELLQITYTIPRQDRQQEHLFGDIRYYGQVIELKYKGELIDAQAWPRILAHKMNKPDAAPVFLDRELPEGYNPYNPLLPNAEFDEPNLNARPDYSDHDLPPPPPDDLAPLPVPPEYQNLPQH